MNTERSEQAMRELRQFLTASTREPPVITFTRVGNLSGDLLSHDSPLPSSEVWLCQRCKALVLGDQDSAREHVNWHSAYSLERWDDTENDA